MALEPAGISLQAQNFSQYIKRLDQIDKRQQKIFNVTSQKTGKTIDEISKAYKGFVAEQKRVISEQKRAKQEAAKLAAAQKTAAATQTQAFISGTQAVISFVKQVGQATFELGKLGAQFQGQQIGLNNLAASFGQSGREIQRAIQDASKGTLSGLDAIQAANQGLLLGVAQTPEEFARLTDSALKLGRTLGLSSTDAIEQFTTALGRQSLLILDNFGISAKQVRTEMERLAQVDFGVAVSKLDAGKKQALFMKAALEIAGDAAKTIGDEAGNAQANFDRLTASITDLKTELGIAISDLNSSLGITEAITNEVRQLTDAIKAFRGTREDATLDEQIEATEIKIKDLERTLKDTRASLEEGGGLFGTGLLEGLLSGLDEDAIDSQTEALEKLKLQLRTLEIKKSGVEARNYSGDLEDLADSTDEATDATKGYKAALKQAQDLQLSFARAAEDAAIKQGRAIEDLARKQARANADIARRETSEVNKLRESQAKDRDKLLKDQQGQLDKFEADRRKQIKQAEKEIANERKAAGEQRKRDQQKLQRDLLQAQERFNLSQLQSERRFKLQESRLIAEGDVIGLKELREDEALRRQEEKESFELGKKEQIASAKEQQREQAKDLESRIKELKSNLEDQRAELLRSFDEQLQAQAEAQAEQKAQLLQGFQEEAAERAIQRQREEEDRQIALQREEEDRQLSQQRQLEDLGRSFAEQEGITEEGASAVADELEKVFGIDGTADTIMTGFTSKTENEFTTLFENLEKIVSGADLTPNTVPIPVSPTGATPGLGVGTAPDRIGGVQEFADGGIVPGPIGSPQIIQAHGGETVLPTHRQSFQMQAPTIPTQTLDVNMSGGFNVTGDGQANEQIMQAAANEMVENFRIAVNRLSRRN